MKLRALAVAMLIATAGASGLLAQDAGVEMVTAPVEIDGTVLFRVRGVSSLTASARAAAIRDRIISVAADSSVSVDAIHTTPVDNTQRIFAGQRLLMAVVEADAGLEQVSTVDLAVAHVQRIRYAIADYRAARTTVALERDAINIASATALTAMLLLFIIWSSRRINRHLASRFQQRIKTVGIQSFEVVRAERIWSALDHVVAGARTIALAAVLLFYVSYSLAQLPWTHGFSQDMVAFAVAPLQVIGGGIVAHIPSLVFLAVLFVVLRVVLRVVRLFFDAVGRGTVTLQNFDAEWADPTYKIARILIVAFGLVVAYPYIPGSQSEAFKGVSLFIGVVFSLGSSTAIANIVAGYMMTYRRAFKVGDRIRVGDAFGEVTRTRLQVTHLRSPKNEELVIPNSQLLGAEVRNYSSLSRDEGLILHTEVGIGYETPWRQVEAMLLIAAERTEAISRERRPFVLQKKLGDFAITYELNVYTDQVSRMPYIYSELHRHILDVFNEYGVQIMTPAYEGDPEIPKIVERKNWNPAPAADAKTEEMLK